jgi:hypothetical protein
MPQQTAQKEFFVISGKTPVLISAPHTFAHFRPNLNMSYKSGESWLDVILQSVASSTGSFGIYSGGIMDYDPNYDPLDKNAYKAEIAALIKQMKIKYFFDLHGLNDIHQYDFGVFYGVRFSRSKKVAYEFASSMNRGSLRNSIVQILNLVYNDQETLTEFVARKLRIPALQIEIAKYIRTEDQLRGDLIQNMSLFINSLAG